MVIELVTALLGGLSPGTAPACTCLCMIPRLESLVHLRPGDAVTTVVFSRRVRDHTRIVLDAGGTYDIRADGFWHDATIRTDAEGFRLRKAPGYAVPFMWIGSFFRRADARYFALIGQIDSRSEQRFKIGKALTGWSPPSSGELVTFANDVRFAYANNRGCLALTVIRKT